MRTFLCADLTPELAARTLHEARTYNELGKNRTALDRYSTYIWMQRIFLNECNDEREQKLISQSIKQAKEERDAIRRRKVPVLTGPLRSYKYSNWSLEGTRRQRLYTPAATGLYMSMHLVGSGSVEKKRYLQDYTKNLPCQELYTGSSPAWDAHTLFNSSGLTNLRAMSAVVDGEYRPEVVHATLIENDIGRRPRSVSYSR